MFLQDNDVGSIRDYLVKILSTARIAPAIPCYERDGLFWVESSTGIVARPGET